MNPLTPPVPISSDSRLPLTLPHLPPQLRVLASNTSSVSEEMWSRGSVYEKQLAEQLVAGPNVAVPPVDKLESLFQYEYGGVVVYDSKLSIVGDPPPLSPSLPLPRPELRKKGLDLAPEGDKKKFLAMKQYSPMPEFERIGQLTVPPEALRFDSRFESGNLKKAIRRQDREYLLLIQEDTESRGHTQWYHFSVSNPKSGSYRFHIINLYKTDSLYREGMLPCVYSTKLAQGWVHTGKDVTYLENNFPLANRPGYKAFTLSFTYEFLKERDIVYFAHAVPYTYTELGAWLAGVRRDHYTVARVDPLCQSLAGNICEMLTITSDISTYQSFQSELLEWNMTASGRKLLRSRIDPDPEKSPHSRKKAVVFTARVHPGETAGSFMLKGAVEFILSDSQEAAFLRSHYVVKIIPMLNPDGVRYGNYRCSVLGVDLNRRWRNPSKYMHPTIFFAKRMMQVLSEHHEIVLFCDFHGHSCKRNAFMYGCTQSFLQLCDRKTNIIAKMIPLLLSQRNPVLAWSHCHFRLDRYRESTARVVAFNEFKVVNSYTLEASFYGPDEARILGRNDAQFLTGDYEKIGRDLMAVSGCFATKAAFIRKLTYIRDLLRQHKPPAASKPLEKSKSAAIFQGEKPTPRRLPTEPKSSARSSLDQYSPSKDTDDPSEAIEGNEVEQAENQLWDTIFEFEDHINEDNASNEEDSSCSEEYEEESKGKSPPSKLGKTLRRSRLKSSESRLVVRRSPDTGREKQGYTRKMGTIANSPKLFRSDRAVFSKSPLVTGGSRTPLRMRQCAAVGGRVGFRTEKGGEGRRMSPSGSSAELVSSFEPFLLTSEPVARSQALLNNATKLAPPRGSIRGSSLKRYGAHEGIPVLEFVRKALCAKKERQAKMAGEIEEAKREIGRRGGLGHDRGSSKG